MTKTLKRRLQGEAPWGLRRAPEEAASARQVELRWRWPVLLALASTVPAFYVELLREAPSWLAPAAYVLAALAVAAALLHAAWRSPRPSQHLGANPLDIGLAGGLLLAAALPPSSSSTLALVLRLLVALLTLVRMVWAVRHLLTRGGLMYMLASATALLAMCGVGFWWLEPKAITLGDGLWLAFTTAATVGYGDIVPSTPASKIFSVFVVMLGYGVLSVVTAAIATRWIETEERIIEREILRDVHSEMMALKKEITALRQDWLLRPDTARPPPDSRKISGPGTTEPA
jgi:voltage-gated potassium channel